MIRVGLTRRQRELLDLIERRETAGQPPPSFDEVMAVLGLASKSGVHRLLSGLEERGYIRRLPNRARAIALVREPEAQTVPVPVAPAERPRLGIPRPVAEQLTAYCDRRRVAARDVIAAALIAYIAGHP